MAAIPGTVVMAAYAEYKDTPADECNDDIPQAASSSNSSGVPADRIAAQQEEANRVKGKIDSKFLEDAKAKFDVGHQSAESHPISKGLTHPKKTLPAEAEVQHHVDLKCLHDTMTARYADLKAHRKEDPAVDTFMNFAFKRFDEETHETHTATMEDLFQSDALQRDIDSRKQHFGLAGRDFAPSVGAREFAEKMKSCKPFDFFCLAYVVTVAGIFGGQVIRKNTQRKYDGKVSSDYYLFPKILDPKLNPGQAIMRSRMFIAEWKRALFEAYPEHLAAFYSTGSQAFNHYIKMMDSEWAPFADK